MKLGFFVTYLSPELSSAQSNRCTIQSEMYHKVIVTKSIVSLQKSLEANHEARIHVSHMNMSFGKLHNFSFKKL